MIVTVAMTAIHAVLIVAIGYYMIKLFTGTREIA